MISREDSKLTSRRLRCTTLIWAACLALAPTLATAEERAVVAKQAPQPGLVDAILDRWEPIAVQSDAHSHAWRELFGTQLRLLDAATLAGIDTVKPDAANTKANYTRFAEAMRSAEFKSYMLAKREKEHLKLGSPTDDQVFVPIVPCRIVDTRNTGGSIAAGTTRNYLFYSTSSADDWSAQGGVPGATGTTCPGTILPNGGIYSPSAAVVTITVVNPTAAGNWVVWGGANPTPTASALNWSAAGQALANTTVVPAGQRSGTGPGGPVGDFAVRYNGPTGSAHFVADVVGYFVMNEGTALDCFENAIQSAPIGGFGAASVTSLSCDAGWTILGGNCDSTDHLRVRVIGKYAFYPQNQFTCIYRNDSSVTDTIYASAICCSVPGR
jgi:hypothetical protein